MRPLQLGRPGDEERDPSSRQQPASPAEGISALADAAEALLEAEAVAVAAAGPPTARHHAAPAGAGGACHGSGSGSGSLKRRSVTPVKRLSTMANNNLDLNSIPVAKRARNLLGLARAAIREARAVAGAVHEHTFGVSH